MATTTKVSTGSYLQIAVEPAQSSFFAGEDFACTITFTNTRIPVPQTQPLPSRSTFESTGLGVEENKQRSVSFNPAHTVLSPLSALPSSRRFHRKSQSVDIRTFARRNQLERGNAEEGEASDERYYRSLILNDGEEDELSQMHAQEFLQALPRRQGLIGKNFRNQSASNSLQSTPKFPDISTPPMKRHNKAFSVATPGSREYAEHLGKGVPSIQTQFASPRIPSHHVNIEASTPSPAGSRAVSSSSRRVSDVIKPTHPHSRKKSVAQVQAEDLSATFELDGTSPGSNTPNGPSSLLNTPRQSLDLRNNRPGGEGFYGLGENSTMESVLREDFTQYSKMGPNGTPISPHASSSDIETVLWTFAQFGGHFQVDESLVKPGEFEQVKQRLAGLGGAGGLSTSSFGAIGQLGPAAIGGGELGAAVDALEGEERKASEGWGSYLRNVLSSGGGSKNATMGAAHRRSGSTLLDTRQKTMASRSIPVLSNPPSMVAVDLELAPGQSRSYTFRVPLPPDLPPSYVGKAISFSYTLTLGTNRLGRNKRGMMEQKSRLVRIPMRVYNHVNISGMTTFYDLTNPIINKRDEAIVKSEEMDIDDTALFDSLSKIEDQKASTGEARRKRRSSRADAIADKALLSYADELLSTCKDENEPSDDDVPTDVEVATLMAQKQRMHDLAVELLSRNSQKVSYDISKDGRVAAILTLVKSKYRLGDTITGVVTINAADSIARVVRIAAFLESHEEIESTLATLPSGRSQKITKTVHSSFHDSTLDAGQACFSLPIPSGATPNFDTSAVRLVWTVRLAFLTSSNVRTSIADSDGNVTISERSKPAPHLIPGPDDGYAAYHRALRAAPSLAGPFVGAAPSDDQSAEAKLEVVECAVPLTVLPHSTRFTVGEVGFMA
ncbi:Rgp1-domain-containing protein [Meira miltonrushii]|uniref:Rgp1-domain-containing protein n=1 Tax=Meira miltonrushii TaxID=1280837 RepID=A0A316VNQ0_9BASI|nr:Rgp1-domain-containing protein [Meira miltonrushii]PWN37145.1 Rgp1-domain-containing protein [Meira miltonrushii]